MVNITVTIRKQTIMKAIITTFALILTISLSAQNTPDETYYENGNVASTTYEENGSTMLTIYHEAGGVKETGQVINGERSGKWERFDEQGNLIIRAYYNNDEKVGNWTYWNADGTLKYSVNYENNMVASYKDYTTQNTVALGDE